MGREKNILLGFLGLLAGVFVGVLSVKLLVPRPPTGTGPDICSTAALATTQERVEPPAPGGWDFATAPPLGPEPAAAGQTATTEPAAESRTDAFPDERPRFSGFATPGDEPPAERKPTPDGDVAPASWRQSEPAAATVEIEAVDLAPAPMAAPAPARTVAVAGEYLVQEGDSWWNVAERAYGDGSLYRALFAWNRGRDPRVSLAPGTRLDVPPLAHLQTAWPRLVTPSDRRR